MRRATQRPHQVRRFGPRPVVAVIAFTGGLVLLVLATRPSPRFTLEAHWRVFGMWALGSAALMVVALIASRRYRWLVVGLSIVALVLAALAHPICIPISKAEQPSFETVVPLAERARRGEPFCRFGTTWYQCKSLLSRALFF